MKKKIQARSGLWSKMTVGASSKQHMMERAIVLDGFHTPRIAVETIVELEELPDRVWEPAAGYHRIANVLREMDFDVFTSDIYRWSKKTEEIVAFEKCRRLPKFWQNKKCAILTNPPFKHAQMFAQHALSLLRPGEKVILLMRTQFLEGNKRYDELFSKTPPKIIYVFSFRLPRMNRFGYKGPQGGSTLAFAWFVWEKGYRGPTHVRWIPRPKN